MIKKTHKKHSIIVTLIFTIIYSICSIFGSIFLVSWGGENLFKACLMFFLTFPIDWVSLIVNESMIYLLLNIIFWSLVVYTITFVFFLIVRSTRKNE